MQILSVEETRALESVADKAGHSYAQMMALAGQGVARAILQRMSVRGRQILVLVGPGNNGGDGLVAARYLKEAGASVTAYLTRERKAETDDVFQQAKEQGVTCIQAKADPEGEKLSFLIRQSHVLIDALLGTGATPPLRGTIAKVVKRTHATLKKAGRPPILTLNALPNATNSRPFIVAVDGPSGMDFDTGKIDEQAFHAHLTITFATPKRGHFRVPAASYIGELAVADIGIPSTIEVESAGPAVVTPDMIRTWLPKRPIDAHKGTFGKALIVAGSANYTGAAALAAISAVRSGAGLTTLAIPSSLHNAIAPQVPESTYLLLPHAIGVISPDAVPILDEQLENYSALLLGPGLGNTSETQTFLQRLLKSPTVTRTVGFRPRDDAEAADSPRQLPALVIDADGLNILSQTPKWHKLLPENTILTPHPGEMSRLTGLKTSEIQADREGCARQFAAKWGHIVLLKGAFTIVAAPDGEQFIIPFANPGLSTAGTGDVLAGAIVSLLAQGIAPFRAAAIGAYVHGLAGEITRHTRGIAGMAASDVASALAEALKRLIG